MPLIRSLKTFPRWMEGSWNVGLNYSSSSKCKPNKGVATRNNFYCHVYVSQLAEKSLIVSNIPVCHLQLFSTLLHL